MRPGVLGAMLLSACLGAWFLVDVEFSTAHLKSVGAPYTTLLYADPILIAWTALLLVVAVPLAYVIPRRVPDFFFAILLRPSTTLFAFLVAVWIAVVGNVISATVLDRQPSDIDDIARLYQARCYLDGRLYVEVPPEHKAFTVYGVHNSHGRMYGKYEPAPSLMYAISWKLFGTPGVINPLLGGMMVAFFYLAIRSTASERTARLAALLLCGSPFVVFMSASLHSHTLTATALTLALFFSLSENRRPGLPRLAAMGAALALALASRPYTTILVGGVLGLHAVFRAGRGEVLIRFLVLVAGAAPLVLLLMGYNAALTGDPFTTPFHASDSQEVPWFGFKGHTLEKGWHNTVGLLRVLNLNLFGWPSSLVFLPLLFLGRWDSADRLALAAVFALIVGMFSYYWTDFGFGARFYYAAAPFFAYLTVRAIGYLDPLLERLGLPRTDHRAALLVVFLFFGFSVIYYLGPLTRLYANDYGQLHPFPAKVVRDQLEDVRLLVLVQGIRAENGGFSSAFLANPLDLAALSRIDRAERDLGRGAIEEIAQALSMSVGKVERLQQEGQILFAREWDAESNRHLREAFPGRLLCRMKHPVRTGTFVIKTAERHGETPPGSTLVEIPMGVQ